MAYKSINIALLGCGVVGGGVVDILFRQRDMIRLRTGLDLNLRHIIVRDMKKYAGLSTQYPGLTLSTDAAAAIADPDVQVIVELIGGTEAAGKYVETALRAGKSVVTANKALLAARGRELFALAKQHEACIAFEASAGGGIPIINALMHGLVSNRIDALVGIVNGTCNFILTKMTKEGWTYGDALKAAQQAGFAEADPTMDVSGRDAAQKLAILASLAFNVQVLERDIHIEGIDRLDATDIKLAGELGYVIKLLAIAERRGEAGVGRGRADIGKRQEPAAGSRSKETTAVGQESIAHQPQLDALSLRVHPTLVHREDVLAEVSGSFNAISVYGDSLGHALFYGRGAGRMPTASAVVADLINVGLGVTQMAFRALSVLPDTTEPARILPFAQLQSRYYLRLMAKDEPGVLAKVTDVLGRQNISLSAILQHEANDGGHVPVVITTHLAQEGALASALKEIDGLPVIGAPTTCLRIIDPPKEFGGN